MPLEKRLSAFPITPSDAEGRIDLPALRALLTPLIDARVDSIGLLGSTGSYPYLARAERRRALEAAVEQAGGRTPILVGVGALRTDDAVRLAQDARAIGATAGLLAPVSYTPLMEEEVFEHYATVVRESGLPICIYNNPSTTHFTFTNALIIRLSQFEGMTGIKNPALDRHMVQGQLEELRTAVPETFSLGYSADWNATEALLAGGDVWYSVLAGIIPQVCVGIVQAIRDGDPARARQLDDQLQPVWDLFKEYSSLRVVYAIAEIRGLSRAQPPRPILPLPDPSKKKIADTLKALNLS